MSEDAAALLEFKAGLKKIEDCIRINDILVRAMAESDDRALRHQFMVGYFLNEDARNAAMKVYTDSFVKILERPQ